MQGEDDKVVLADDRSIDDSDAHILAMRPSENPGRREFL
jgi:hypothetical protein